MEKIETFEDLLATPPLSKIYCISHGKIYAQRFITAYSTGEYDVAIIDGGGEIYALNSPDFFNKRKYTSYWSKITADGAEQVVIAQLEAKKAYIDESIKGLGGPFRVINDFQE